MYRIFLTNFRYFKDFSTDGLDAAIAEAKRCGFEVVIYRGETPYASYSPIGGYRVL